MTRNSLPIYLSPCLPHHPSAILPQACGPELDRNELFDFERVALGGRIFEPPPSPPVGPQFPKTDFRGGIKRSAITESGYGEWVAATGPFLVTRASRAANVEEGIEAMEGLGVLASKTTPQLKAGTMKLLYILNTASCHNGQSSQVKLHTATQFDPTLPHATQRHKTSSTIHHLAHRP